MKELYRALAQLSPPRDRRSLRVLLQAATRAGAVPPDVGQWLQAVLELPDLQVRDAMVPRVDVLALADTCELVDAARQMAEHGRKRVPVFRGTIDHPIGVLHAVDVAGALAASDRNAAPPNVGQLVRAAPSVSESLPIVEAIRIIRSQEAHLLLVLDDHEGFAGLVTLHDLVEQLLGPFPAEYGVHDRHSVHVISKDEIIVGGATPLHEIELLLNVRFPRSEFVSIGGLVYASLRGVPRVGDVVELPGMRIEVLSVEGHRIGELRIRSAASISPDARLVDIGFGKEVVCGADAVARVERLITEPKTGRVTSFVARRDDRLVVVPLDVVERTDEGVVYLIPSACDLARFPAYTQPELSERTEVVTIDGHVGSVRKVELDATTGRATHVVVRMSSGLLVPRDVVVSLSWARTVTPQRIELVASRDDLLGMPEYRDDDDIWADILRELAEDPRFEGLDRYTLKVEVKGGVVRLEGRVRTTAVKLAAEELAVRTRGVVSVTNELLADDEIERKVERALRSNGLHIEQLEVSVLLGNAKLRGQVASAEDRAAAVRVARSVAGVESVVDELVVQPSGVR